MNRAERRAQGRAQRRAPRPGRPGIDGARVRLAAQPWKIDAVFHPLEQLIGQIERTGCVDDYRGRAVFMEHGAGGYYEVVPAIRGIVAFHDLAAQRCGQHLDTGPLTRLANKLHADSPLSETDLAAARGCIAALRGLAARLTAGQARQLLADTLAADQAAQTAGIPI